MVSLRWAHGETVVVDPWEPQQSVDEYGNSVSGFGASFTIASCAFAPGGSVLDISGHTERRVETTPTLYSPPGTRITAKSKVSVVGTVFEAVSDTKVWVSPYTGSEVGGVTELRVIT